MLHRSGPRSVLRDFLASEAAGGILLMLAAALAMLIANSPFGAVYYAALHVPIGPFSALHWVNEALMALFFLLVGLEIKREFTGGHLSSWTDRRLPLIAAAAGMALPALIYLVATRADPALARGWAIPAATDIAFAIGVLALLGKRVPASLKLFLTTVAIADDMGAVAIIALVYTATIEPVALGIAAAIFLLMIGLNRAGVRRLWPYLLFALLLWLAISESGVHPTIAGVLAASTIPVRRTTDGDDADASPLHRLEHRLQPWIAYAVVPLFGLANAGVRLGGLGGGTWTAPLPIAIVAGLFVGKQIGIFLSVRLAVALGLGSRPVGASWPQIYGVGMLCGIGFTMSLFIGDLAFADPHFADAVKIGVFGGSLLSAAAGYLLLRLAPRAGEMPAGRQG